jgi:pentatricopeptide repeat protein
MKTRNIPLSPDILGNLISAYGTMGLPQKVMGVWREIPEVAESTGHLRAKLLSITAVALARNGKFFDKEVQEAMVLLRSFDPNPIEYQSWYTWGRLIHAFVLCKNMPAAEKVFASYQDSMPIKEYTPVNLYNTMIRGYGDVGNLYKALQMFDQARKILGRIDPETELDVVMAISKCCGIDGSVEFLVREGSFKERPEPFQRLLSMLLDQGDLKNAKRLFQEMCSDLGEDTDEIMTEDAMRTKVSLTQGTLKKHPLWQKKLPDWRKFSWVDILCHVSNTNLLESLFKTGMMHFKRSEYQRLLRHCEALGSVAGMRMLLEHRVQSPGYVNIWEDWDFGVEVLKRLGKVRLRHAGDVRVVKAAGDLAADIEERWPLGKFFDKPLRQLVIIYAKGPREEDAASKSKLLELVPPSKAHFAELVSQRRQNEILWGISCLIEHSLFDHTYVQCLVPALLEANRLNKNFFAEVMVLLVPQYAPVDTVAMRDRECELAYWQKVVVLAKDVETVKLALSKCMGVGSVPVSIWREAANVFVRLGCAESLDWLETVIPVEFSGILLVANAKIEDREEEVQRIFDEHEKSGVLTEKFSSHFDEAKYIIFKRNRRPQKNKD